MLSVGGIDCFEIGRLQTSDLRSDAADVGFEVGRHVLTTVFPPFQRKGLPHLGTWR